MAPAPAQVPILCHHHFLPTWLKTPGQPLFSSPTLALTVVISVKYKYVYVSLHSNAQASFPFRMKVSFMRTPCHTLGCLSMFVLILLSLNSLCWVCHILSSLGLTCVLLNSKYSVFTQPSCVSGWAPPFPRSLPWALLMNFLAWVGVLSLLSCLIGA